MNLYAAAQVATQRLADVLSNKFKTIALGESLLYASEDIGKKLPAVFVTPGIGTDTAEEQTYRKRITIRETIGVTVAVPTTNPDCDCVAGELLGDVVNTLDAYGSTLGRFGFTGFLAPEYQLGYALHRATFTITFNLERS